MRDHFFVLWLKRRFKRLEKKMSKLSEQLAELKTALSEAIARIDEDFAALKQKIEEGTVTPEDTASLQETIDQLKTIDPDPDNPPPG